MIWDDDRDSVDTQRLKNLVFLKLPVSNRTRDDMMPAIGFGILFVSIIAFVVWGLS